MRVVHELLRDRTGATAIEYGLIAAFIAIVIVAVIAGIGNQLNGLLLAAGAGFGGA